MDVLLAGGDGAHRADHLGVDRLLEDVSGRTGLERLAHVPGIVLHGQHEDTRVRARLEHRGQALDTRLPGHDDVHHDDVGLVRQDLEHGAVDRLRLPDHLDVGLRVEHPPQPGAKDRVVVDEHDADHSLHLVVAGSRLRMGVMLSRRGDACRTTSHPYGRRVVAKIAWRNSSPCGSSASEMTGIGRPPT